MSARFSTPADALRLGIGMLHQDPLDFLPMKALDNFLMGRPGFVHDRRRARQEFAELSARFGFAVDADAPVGRLTVGERQQLEIVRLLASGVKAFILDEPTTGISAAQKEHLFMTLCLLAEQGKTIIFVSHKLADVHQLCSHIAILRKGRVVGEATAPFTTDWMVERMFGQALTSTVRQPAQDSGDALVRIDQVYAQDGRLRTGPISLTANAGEVIGVAGIEGSGQRAFLQVCGGLLRPLAGRVYIGDADLTGQHYRRFRRAGVAYVPAGRLDEGLVAGLDLTEHVLLTQDAPPFVLNWETARAQAVERIKVFSVVGTPESQVDALSGGNQQRALLALLPPHLRLLLLEHPTRGLDIESTRWIWDLLLQRRQKGTAIIFASSDLDEILERSDRVIVFSGGEVIGLRRTEELTVQQLGELIGGNG
jgi:simple sugar transport system ATP-binding protein